MQRKANAQGSGSRRRLANERIPLDFVITETKHGELSQSVNGDSSTASEEASMASTGAQLNAFGKQLVDAPAATLTKNTQVQIVNSFQITQAATIPIPGWTECERVLFQDGICDCNCGRWDPDCNAQQDAELNPRGCPSSNITHSVESVRKFCVNNIDTVVCENVDEDDLCAEWPCDHGASVELKKDVNRATSFTSVCKQTSASDPLPEDGYLHDSKCALVFNYDAVVEEGKEGEKEEDEEEKKCCRKSNTSNFQDCTEKHRRLDTFCHYFRVHCSHHYYFGMVFQMV